jgi:deazaflavin-dependent oxidoreductase (nitroreductase family)
MERPGDRRKRRFLRAFWRVANPLARPLSGVVPWWVLLETTGHVSGVIRRTPLATGPMDGDAMLLIAVHGRRSGWVRNLEADPNVRLRHRRRWRAATATVEPLEADVVRRFNVYARSGPSLVGLDPLLVRVRFGDRPVAAR